MISLAGSRRKGSSSIPKHLPDIFLQTHSGPYDPECRALSVSSWSVLVWTQWCQSFCVTICAFIFSSIWTAAGQGCNRRTGHLSFLDVFFCLSFGSQPQEEPLRDGIVIQREKVMRRGKGRTLGAGSCCLFEMRFSSAAQLFYMSCREAAAQSCTRTQTRTRTHTRKWQVIILDLHS